MASIDAEVAEQLAGTGYTGARVQWNDVARSKGSCYGVNITDATLLNATTKKPVMVIRPSNFGDKVVEIPASEIAVMGRVDDATITPTTLEKFLKDFGANASAVYHEHDADLYALALDGKVTLRFQAVFIEAGEFVAEHYNYQAADGDPANALLLATTQGTSVTRDAAGKVELLLQKPGVGGGVSTTHTMQIEATRFGVGGPQLETAEETAAAFAAGKATTAVIGPRVLGTRLNTLMVIQVPLEQRRKPMYRGGGGPLYGAAAFEKGYSDGDCGALDYGKGYSDSEDDDDFAMRGVSSRGVKSKKVYGKTTAGRVSIGKQVGYATPLVPLEYKVQRHGSAHITATVMLYYVVDGGVPKPEDVERAVSELNTLYAAGGGVSIHDSVGSTTDEPVFKSAALAASAMVVDPTSFPQ